MNKEEYLESIKDDIKYSKITSIEQIDGMSLHEFRTKYSYYYVNDRFLAKFIDYGVITVPEGEIPVCKLDMSARLRNILCRNQVFVLSEIKVIPVEEWSTIRNMGNGMKNELLKLCEENGVQPYYISMLRDRLFGIDFANYQLRDLHRFGVKCPEDLKNMDADKMELLTKINKGIDKKITKVLAILDGDT